MNLSTKTKIVLLFIAVIATISWAFYESEKLQKENQEQKKVHHSSDTQAV